MNASRSYADRLEVLLATVELAGWPEGSLRALLPHFDEVRLPAGRRIAVEGRTCNEFLVVLEGRVKAWSSSGDSHLLRTGDSAGWRAMWDRGSNEATLVVESDARLLVMGHAQFRAVKAEATGRAHDRVELDAARPVLRRAG